MAERLYSENYKKFIRGVNNSDYTIQEIANYTKKSMYLVADDLHIGRLEAIVVAKPNLIDRVGYDGKELLYMSKDGYSPNLYSMDFKTGSGVSITMNAYPIKDYVWNDEEKDDLYFICSNFFQLFERSRMASIIHRASLTDSMTGAYNINGMLKAGSDIMMKGKLSNYSTVFTNMKNLKLINRNLGNEQGDNVLRGFVDKLSGFMFPEEAVARLGGDNFVILIRTDRVRDLIRLLSPLKLTVDVSGEQKNLEFFFRMGIYEIEPNSDIRKAITNSSSALAATRQEGAEDIIWFDEVMHRREMEAKQITFLFSKALINNEFKVFYQPKVKLADGTLCGSEALVRWIRDGRLLPPMSFIPALEHDGSICELDYYVFETVCRDIRMWLDSGIEPVKISVNFSRFHIRDENFPKKLLAIVDRYNIDTQYIEVELTESACYEDYPKLKVFLEMMKKRKISVSIDDFGTGYSSLSLLKDLMVDVIKLDQSFVRGIDIHGNNMDFVNNDMIVIKNIVKMVNELDMGIIAEGVETLEEANFLKNVECDMAQGYLFDKPMAHDDFELLLRGNRIYDK